MKLLVCSTVALLLALTQLASGTVLFQDNFDAGASNDWGNEFGDWVTVGGVYYATVLSSSPPSYTSITSLPELTDFTVEFDINGVRDGGVFLRSHRCENGEVEGVLFLAGGWHGSYQGVYWHIWDCSGHGPMLDHVEIPGFQGSDAHVVVSVQDSTYNVCINGSPEPVASLVTNRYDSGAVALYQCFPQSFDNVVVYDHPPTGMEASDARSGVALLPSFPNPFDPATQVCYRLPSAGVVKLRVFDVSGRVVKVLVDGHVKEAGAHQVTWDGCDDDGHFVAAGVYFCRLEAHGVAYTGRVVLLR